MFVLPPIRASLPKSKKSRPKTLFQRIIWTGISFILLVSFMFSLDSAPFVADTCPIHADRASYFQTQVSDLPMALAAPPENISIKKYPWIWSLILTAGVLLIAYLAKYLSDAQLLSKKGKTITYEIPNSPHQLRKPLANIFLQINSALEKLNNADPNGTANNLIAIEGECIHILQYIEEQPNIDTKNQAPMKETKAHPNWMYESSLTINDNSKIVDNSTENILNQEVHQDDLLIQKVMEQINLYKDNTDFNVEMLCRKVGMSYSQLHRKITLLSGKNPNQLIKEARLARAKELLLNHEINIGDVAFLSGYNDPSYFSRIFTKEIAMTPTEYREKNKNVRPSNMSSLFSRA